mgnify:CR=1 FL=1
MGETEAERKASMDAWMGWFGSLGDKVVDGGNPCTVSRAIGSDGSVMEPTMAPSGYSVIRADSLDEAVAAAKSCPVLASGGQVLVSETINAM